MSPGREHDPNWSPAPLNGWPDRRRAEPGNELSVRHGAYSPAKIAAKAAAVHEALLEVAPWCNEPHYLPSVNRYLDATAREQLAHRAIEASAGKVSPRLLEAATAASRLAWQMGDQLGLTPAGHARLKTITAASVGAEASLADLMATGREARLLAEARMAETPAQPSPAPSEPIEAVTAADGASDGKDGDL